LTVTSVNFGCAARARGTVCTIGLADPLKEQRRCTETGPKIQL